MFPDGFKMVAGNPLLRRDDSATNKATRSIEWYVKDGSPCRVVKPAFIAIVACESQLPINVSCLLRYQQIYEVSQSANKHDVGVTTRTGRKCMALFHRISLPVLEIGGFEP